MRMDSRALNNAVVAALIAAAGENKDLVDDASAKRAVAELPNATYVELDCEDHPPWLGDTEQVRREIAGFFDRVPSSTGSSR